MNIIPVINQLISEIYITTEKFLDHPEEFSQMEESLIRIHERSCREVIVKILEELDQFINSNPRRKEGYTIQRHDDRTLITACGDITFNRTLYRKRSDGSYHYLLDEKIRLPKDEHFSELAEVKVLQAATESSYQSAADTLSIGMQKISKVSVMNKVHGIIDDLPEESPTERKKCKYLYIEADEDHIHRQVNGEEVTGCIIGKLVYVFEGKEEVCKGRRKLVNPMYFGGQYKGSEENAQLWKEVQRYIRRNYDSSELKTVYICSDGGSWIRAATDYIDKAVLVADKFHLMKYINQVSRLMLDECDEVKGKFYKNIYKNRRDKVEKLLRRIRRSSDKDKVIDESEKFLLNNWDAIQRAFRDKHVLGCSAEGHVSHVFSSRMSTRPMAWSERGADCMCRLRCLKESYGKEKIAELVHIRRERACTELEATGTDGAPVQLSTARRTYTKAQLEAASYAERMHATLGNSLARKEICIRMQEWL